jgi:hypothetical protein
MGLSILLFNWEVEIATDLDDSQKQMLSKNLNSIGFELLDDKENKTVERIKTESLTWYIIKRRTKNKSIKLFGDDLGQDYSMLSKLFSEKEGATLPIILLLKKLNVQKHYYFITR